MGDIFQKFKRSSKELEISEKFDNFSPDLNFDPDLHLTAAISRTLIAPPLNMEPIFIKISKPKQSRFGVFFLSIHD